MGVAVWHSAQRDASANASLRYGGERTHGVRRTHRASGRTAANIRGRRSDPRRAAAILLIFTKVFVAALSVMAPWALAM
jgi:hypothetical protein